MASILAYLEARALAKHAKKGISAGATLPIDRYTTTETSFATVLSHGGALYLVTDGEGEEVWLVAVLEAPECAGIKRGDKRPAGWYAAPNTTPVTDIAKLRKRLKLTRDLADRLDPPIALTPGMEQAVREMIGESDAPVIGPAEIQAVAPPKLTGAPLERAARYFAGAYVDAGTEAVIEAWRDNRVPELADLIDRATRVAPTYDRPLFDRRVRAYDDNSPIWDQAFARDPIAAMPQLLQNLPIGGEDMIPERASRLAELREDPRLGARLVELIPCWPGQFNPSPKHWNPIIDIWKRGRDLRLCEGILEAEPSVPWLEARQMFDLAREPARYFKKRPELGDADRVLIEAIERELARLEEPHRLECDLVEAIAANPDDDAPRLIYADRLQERGHPRGEYIALAIRKHRGSLTPALARRFAALAELPYLYGPLDDLASRTLRPADRGIDRELHVYWNALPRTWLEVAAHPLARALEKIELAGNPRNGRGDGIVALARVASRLERISGIGGRAGKQVVASLAGKFKLVGRDLVRS